MSKYSTKFKRWFWSDNVQSHVRAFRNTWLSVMIVDGIGQMLTVYNGDFSTSALIALATASANAIVKTIFQLAIPQVFPAKSTSAGTGSVSIQMTKGIDGQKKKNYN